MNERTSLSSGERLFRCNPFRVLRIEVQTSSEAAVWQAEKILALHRSGVELPQPLLIPWLAPPDEFDIQQAAQQLEEPIRRLVDQVGWFDFHRDPHGALLRDALSSGAPELAERYIQAEDGVSAEPVVAYAAHTLNQANLRLLLGFSRLNGRGPLPPSVTAPPPAAPGGDRGPIVFQICDGVEVADSLHGQVATGAAAMSDGGWSELLGQGYGRWHVLLGESAFISYLEATLRELADDRLNIDDSEVVGAAISTSLCDTVVGELRSRLQAGQLDAVPGLVQAAAMGPSKDAAWTLAARPLREFFASELREADALLAPLSEQATNLADLEQFLKRLKQLDARWRRLDAGGRLGLDELIDQAVERAFRELNVLEGIGRSLTLRTHLADLAYALAHARSLKEKIKGYINKLNDYAGKYTCHYCGTRDRDSEHPLVLWKKRISRDDSDGHTHYRQYTTQAGLIPRCTRCANYHGFLRFHHLAIAWLAGIFILATPAIAVWNWYSEMSPREQDAVVSELPVICFWTGGCIVFLYEICRRINPFLPGDIAKGLFRELGNLFSWIGKKITARTTPQGERSAFDYIDSFANQSLIDEGFYSSVDTLDISKDALQRLISVRS